MIPYFLNSTTLRDSGHGRFLSD